MKFHTTNAKQETCPFLCICYALYIRFPLRLSSYTSWNLQVEYMFLSDFLCRIRPFFFLWKLLMFIHSQKYILNIRKHITTCTIETVRMIAMMPDTIKHAAHNYSLLHACSIIDILARITMCLSRPEKKNTN